MALVVALALVVAVVVLAVLALVVALALALVVLWRLRRLLHLRGPFCAHLLLEMSKASDARARRSTHRSSAFRTFW